jgi:hypothetical protein
MYHDGIERQSDRQKIATVAIDESGIDGKPITVGNACSKMVSTLCIF